MKRDIDLLLRERGLAAAVVLKGEFPNPTFRYVAGPPAAHMTTGIIVCRAGATPFLLHGGMERDAAVETGFERAEYGDFAYSKILAEESSSLRAYARLIERVLDRAGVTNGPVLIGGIMDVGRGYHVLNRLRELMPGITLAEDTDPGLFLKARLTKDADEVEAVRAVGRVCERAFARVRQVIAGGRLEGAKLKDAQGWVTIGRLRAEVRRVFFEAGLEEPHGNIIAMGRDAGVPHNSGNDADVLEEGKPIVIDLFPVQSGGGYYFDVTRTICVGRAPSELRDLHALVREAVDRTMETIHEGSPGRTYQEQVCDLFEARGHKTIRQDERLEEGYVHGLGHGIGLEIHERPNLSGNAANRDRIEAGSLFTVEPGLYYPSRGLGIRIEDVAWVKPDGSVENLTNIPYELEVAPA
ncbi:MAG TPA: Xaa-Pro peptidase family protein [Candidatus Binatia bacterium]|nr:Xaa-Pro peptidase family protein [Candidatus Binatia bacterium]